ncbi:hypothetical protein ES703_55300 [subsurface metagenome]
MGRGQETPTIDIQIGAVSFLDEGVGSLLDELQKRARINRKRKELW